MDIYEERVNQKRLENIQKVLDEIDSEDILIKVKNHSKRTGISEEKIFNSIKEDEVVRSFFAKDPVKQNIYENIALEYLSSAFNAIKLPVSGENSLVINHEGKLTNPKSSPLETKTIDFLIDHNNHKIFTTHKYTKNRGGDQDNQYADVKKFLEYACKNNEHYFLAIVDGEYYTDVVVNLLRKNFSKENVYVLRMWEVKDWIEKNL